MKEIIIEEYKEKLDVKKIIQIELEKQENETKKIEELPTFEQFLKGRRFKR